MIAENPMARMKKPQMAERLVPVLTPEQIESLIKAAAGRDFEARRDTAIILAFLDTGARLSEPAGFSGALPVGETGAWTSTPASSTSSAKGTASGRGSNTGKLAELYVYQGLHWSGESAPSLRGPAFVAQAQALTTGRGRSHRPC